VSGHTPGDQLDLDAIEQTALAAEASWGAQWKAMGSKAWGWRSGRLGAEPKMPFVVTDDEHGSLLLMSMWPEDMSTLTDHVATVDPATALALVAEVRRLRAQNESLRDVAAGRVEHRYMGGCPDALEGYEVRDPDCPACAVLVP
jgi:hypothetical protein